MMTQLAERNYSNINFPSSRQHDRKAGGYNGKSPRAKNWGSAGKAGAKG